MKAVSFMYVRPPGYNAESAKAAEIADEQKREEQNNPSQDPLADGASTAMYHLHLCLAFVYNSKLELICPRKEKKNERIEMHFVLCSNIFTMLFPKVKIKK